MTVDSHRCNGIKADGKRCGLTRMTNWGGKRAPKFTPEPWFCHSHKDQATQARKEAS